MGILVGPLILAKTVSGVALKAVESQAQDKDTLQDPVSKIKIKTKSEHGKWRESSQDALWRPGFSGACEADSSAGAAPAHSSCSRKGPVRV